MKRLILLFILLPFISYNQYTAIPDENFEQALIDLNYDDVIDGKVLTANISNVTRLEGLKNISNLTGIEDFIALTSLNCSWNKLTSLDVSKNKALIYLNVEKNKIDCEHLSWALVVLKIELKEFKC